MSVSAITTTLIGPLETFSCGGCFAGVGGVFWPGGVFGCFSGAGGPFGNAVLAMPEIRAAIVYCCPVGTIWFINDCGSGLKRTIMASIGPALAEEVTSGLKVV